MIELEPTLTELEPTLEVTPMTDILSQKHPRRLLPRSERWRKGGVFALLIFVTMIWGSTFLVVQHTIALVGPYTFLALRFSIGALALGIIFHKRLARISRAEIISGSIISLFLFGSYTFQTIGLQYTTTSKAGFITGMYVPLVAMLAVPMLRQRPTTGGVLGVILSMAGLFLISVNRSFQLSFDLGEYLIMGCAIATAFHVIFVSKFAPKVDAINLTVVQTAVTALFCVVAMGIAHEPFVLPVLPVWGSVLFMGVIATALALAVMNRVQQFVSSTQATLIYALELVWVGLLGMLVGEQLSFFAWIGCASIFLGMITGSLRLPKRSKKTEKLV